MLFLCNFCMGDLWLELEEWIINNIEMWSTKSYKNPIIEISIEVIGKRERGGRFWTMAGSTGANSSSNSSPAPPPPKILLAKPGLVPGGPINSKIGRGAGADDEPASIRSRLPSLGSLNLLSDSWDLHIDRFLPVNNLYFPLFFLLFSSSCYRYSKTVNLLLELFVA